MDSEYLNMIEDAEASATIGTQGPEDNVVNIEIVPAITRWEELPELPDQLIEGIVFKGGKIILAGAPKSGKSWLLIELAVAVATGTSWIGYKCARGRVLFVNLEVPTRQFMRRIFSVFDKLCADEELVMKNLGIANLRGKVSDIEVLVDVLLETISPGEYDLIIIDPAYKVQSGAENEAASITSFCGQLDRLASELGCSIAYSHHHSKGSQGGKNAMDRASGSGVFSRDADAMIDMIELEQSSVVLEVKREFGLEDARPFRIEAIVRDFKMPEPKCIWFDHPIHEVDFTKALDNARPKGAGSPNASSKKIEDLEEKLDKFIGDRDEVERKDFLDAHPMDPRTFKNRIQQSSLFECESDDNSSVIRRVKE